MLRTVPTPCAQYKAQMPLKGNFLKNLHAKPSRRERRRENLHLHRVALFDSEA